MIYVSKHIIVYVPIHSAFEHLVSSVSLNLDYRIHESPLLASPDCLHAGAVVYVLNQGISLSILIVIHVGPQDLAVLGKPFVQYLEINGRIQVLKLN